MEKFFAKFISFILNPLIILVPVPYFLVLKTTGNQDYAFFWTIFTLIFLLFFFLFVLIGIEKKIFSDFDISKRTQRFFLYTFAISLSSVYTVFLYFLKAPEVLFLAVIGLILGLVSIETINKITKASVHVATMAAFSTSFILTYGLVFLPVFLLVPLVAWARLVGHNHTRRQVVIGGVLGTMITLVVYVIFKYII